ncbi:hypothetical protein SAMN04488109_4430 [Chryseolinea serpens]|uniref:Uncharacterized protein n=1 Tax=Chryseolinea serpens TaxID=947013 RepID=A0A1M5U3E1_9BACT|nr:hypothetical protein SAMN04488109_4430 [Chryseolinea serpens]
MGLDSLKSYSKNDVDGCFYDKKKRNVGPLDRSGKNYNGVAE